MSVTIDNHFSINQFRERLERSSVIRSLFKLKSDVTGQVSQFVFRHRTFLACLFGALIFICIFMLTILLSTWKVEPQSNLSDLSDAQLLEDPTSGYHCITDDAAGKNSRYWKCLRENQMIDNNQKIGAQFTMGGYIEPTFLTDGEQAQKDTDPEMIVVVPDSTTVFAVKLGLFLGLIIVSVIPVLVWYYNGKWPVTLPDKLGAAEISGNQGQTALVSMELVTDTETPPGVETETDFDGRTDERENQLEEIVSSTAHQLKTPLSVLHMRLQLMERCKDRERLMGDVQWINRIVDQLENFSGLDRQKIDQAETFALCDLAEQLVSATEPMCVQNNFRVVLDVPAEPVIVAGRFALAFEAAANILDNAMRYTPSGSEILLQVDQKGCLNISDRGPGIPAKLRKKIFKRYFRGSDTSPGGAGLGLKIASDVMRAHKGTITVAEREGGGTTFTLAFRQAIGIQIRSGLSVPADSDAKTSRVPR